MTEFLGVPVQWKAADGDTNVVEGYASTFGNVDLHGDVVRRGAFKKTIKERVPKGLVKLLDSHIPDSEHVLGTVVEAKEDSTGLWFRARLSSAASVQDIKTKMLEGHLDRLSIGYSTVKESWAKDDDGNPVRNLDELKWFEASVVPFPANEEAALLAVKNAVTAASGQLAEVDDHAKRDVAEHMADSLKDVFGSQVTLVVGSTAEEVKAALDANHDDADTDDENVDTKDSPLVAAEEAPPETDEPTEKPSLKEIIRRAKAELEDRDPDEVAEPTQVASLTTRLDLEERRLRDLLPAQEEAS